MRIQSWFLNLDFDEYIVTVRKKRLIHLFLAGLAPSDKNFVSWGFSHTHTLASLKAGAADMLAPQEPM